MTSFLDHKPKRSILLWYCTWAVLAGLAFMLVVLNQPAHTRNILSEWQVGQVLTGLPVFLPDHYFAIYLLLLRYICLALCWLAAGVIILKRSNAWPASRQLAAGVTAAALLLVPLTFNLAGEFLGTTYPGSWGKLLEGISNTLPIVGLLAFLLSLQLYPDGHFTPRWLRYPTVLVVLIMGTFFSGLLTQSGITEEWGWPILIFSMLTGLLLGALSQAVRYRRALDFAQRRQLRPVLVFTVLLLLWLVFSISELLPESGWRALLDLHSQVLLLGFFAIANLAAIRNTQLWDIHWHPHPLILAVTFPALALLLGWWLSPPILRQAEVQARLEVTVSDIPAEPQIPLIYDTDLAVDDYIAMLYLLQHPAVRMQAITVAGTGEAHCKPGVENVLSVLDYLQAPHIPVSCGRETPLAGEHAFPNAWREGVDNFFGIDLPPAQRNPDPASAPELIARVLKQSAQPVTILAVGPLTNIAEMLQSHPELVSQIAHIYIMGGAVTTGGNVWLETTTYAFAEWNIYVDPLAANIILQSGAPVSLVPLDATDKVPVERQFKRRLVQSAAAPAAQLANRLLETVTPDIGSYYFWDTLTAAVVTDPSLVTFREVGLRVIEEEGPQSGRTVMEPSAQPARFASTASRRRFEGLLLAVLNLP